MFYSDVIKSGLILPKREKYTMRDVNNLINDSLFGGYNHTMSVKKAKFIVRCSAIHHDTDYSKACNNAHVTNII